MLSPVRRGWVSARPSRRRQQPRGLSLVELMVGLALGLFVVAAAALIVSNQLNDNRRLLLEAQVQQDLRASVDIIARDLRRSGSVGDDVSRQSAWSAGSGTVFRNVLAPVQITAGTYDSITFDYAPTANVSGPYGFRVVSRTVGERTVGVLQANLGRLGTSNWQDLTDSYTVDITAMQVSSVAPTTANRQTIPCPTLCPDGTQACWPELHVRELRVAVTGRAVRDDRVVRTVVAHVRPRNDWVKFNTTGSSDASLQTASCPP
jgi:type II secretory pathway pseudopilin PulG